MKIFPNRIKAFVWMVCFSAITLVGCAQTPPVGRPSTTNPALDQRLTSLLRYDVPLIGADSLAGLKDIAIFDTRKQKEYSVSHIPGAIQLSPKQAIPSWILERDRDKTIVLYCSVGYRSENVARKLQQQGFTNVYNLYGSIFDWVEKGYPLEDAKGDSTLRVHTYNQRWGKLLTRPDVDKTW
ncbi:MAG: rhodanese-like domain-containing protein [Saprospiraceae bacterium]